MKVYRIALARYSKELKASGRAARWNTNDLEVIYSSSSIALACLENVVHRSQLGLNANFKVMVIHIPDDLAVTTISETGLRKDWNRFESLSYTQQIGDQWLQKAATAILKVPSSVVRQEFNFLINPHHPDFEKIRLEEVKAFDFDERIKRN